VIVSRYCDTTNPSFMTDLIALLSRLDLKSDEALMLLTLYQHPGSSAGRLAEHAQFKRGLTYNILASLIVKGFVHEVIDRGVKRFTAIPPLQLVQRVLEKQKELARLEQDLNNALSRIETLIPNLSSLPRVQVFRGASRVKELYQFTLTCKEKLIRACGDFGTTFPQNKSHELHQWLLRYASRRAKRGILYKGIISRSAESDIAYKKRVAQKRLLKLLPPRSLSVEINIFDSYVAIMSTSEESMGVLIESLPIAQSAKQLFDTFWEFLPNYTVSVKKKT